MVGFNNWDLVAATEQDFIDEWVDVTWASYINQGGTSVVNGFSISNPRITINESTTKYTSSVTIAANVTGDSVSGTVSVIVNLDTLYFSIVSFPTYVGIDGSDSSYVNCGQLSEALPGSGFSTTAWFQFANEADLSNEQTLVRLSGSYDFTLSVKNSSPIITIAGKPYTPSWGGEDYPVFEAEVWYHLSAVVSGTEIFIYINGQPQGSIEITELSSMTSGPTVYVGGMKSGNSFNGEISGVGIWSSALSAEQVIQVLNGNPSLGNVPSGQTCLGYWLFSPKTDPVAANLMDPSIGSIFEGSAAPMSDDTPPSSTFLFFTTRNTSDVAVVHSEVVSTIDPAIEQAITSLITAEIEAGGYRLDKGPTTQNEGVPTYLRFLTEYSSISGWEGSTQLFAVGKMDNGITPVLSTLQTDISKYYPSLQISPGNSLMAVSDLFIMNTLANALNTRTFLNDSLKVTAKTFMVGSTPAVGLNISGKMQPTKGLPIDVTVSVNMNGSVRIVDGTGIAVRFSGTVEVSSLVTLEIELGFVMSFFTEMDNGVQYIYVKFNDEEVNVKQVDSFLMVILILIFVLIQIIILIISPKLWTKLMNLFFRLSEEARTKILNFLNQHNNKEITAVPFSAFHIDKFVYSDGMIVQGTASSEGCVITSVNPSSAEVGNPVTIEGADFIDSKTSTSRVTSVQLAGYTYDSSEIKVTGSAANGKIVVDITSGSGVVAPVLVTVAIGSNSYTATSSDTFRVLGTVIPANVEYAKPKASVYAGETIQVVGENFIGASKVTFESPQQPSFGRIPAHSITVSSDKELSVIIPDAISNTTEQGTMWNVRVYGNKDDDTTGTVSTSWIVLASPPKLTSIAGAEHGTYAIPGESITLTGSGFTSYKSEDLSADAAPPFTAYFSRSSDGTKTVFATCEVQSDTEMTCTVPTGVVSSSPVDASKATVNVVGPTGPSKKVAFQIQADPQLKPSISGFSPKAGGTASATVTISGSNWTGTSGVYLGEAPVKFALNSTADTIYLSFTDGTLDSGKFKVTNADGTSVVSTDEFEFYKTPIVSRVSTQDPDIGGPLTVLGQHFVDAEGKSIVTGASINASVVQDVQVSSDSNGDTATFTIPLTTLTQSKSAVIGIKTPGGAANFTTDMNIHALGRPSITKVDPTSGGETTIVNVSGVNLAGIRLLRLIPVSSGNPTRLGTTTQIVGTKLSLVKDESDPTLMVKATFVPKNSRDKDIPDGVYNVQAQNQVGMSEDNENSKFTKTSSAGLETADILGRDLQENGEKVQTLESSDIDSLWKEAEIAALEKLRTLGPEAFRDWPITELLNSRQTGFRMASE